MPKKKAKRTTARKTVRTARRPAPKRLSADLRDLNVVWYNVSDWERAKKFYGETLGLPVALQIDQAGWIEYGLPNQTHIGINKWQGPDSMPPVLGGATVTFGVDDVRAMIAKLRSKGVRCDNAEEIPGMVILASFYDPDGNRLQVAQTLMR